MNRRLTRGDLCFCDTLLFDGTRACLLPTAGILCLSCAIRPQILCALFEQCGDLFVQHIQRHAIITALRNDEVGEFFTWFHELLVHRFYCCQILRHDRLQRPAALVDIADDTAYDAHIGIRIDKNLDVAEISELLVLEDQNALDDDDLGRLYQHRLIDAVMDRKIVDRPVDTLPHRQAAHMLDHQIRIKGIRMVIIQFFSFLKRDFIVLLVIKIVAQHGDLIAEFVLDLLDQGTLAGTGSARDTDNNDVFHILSPF